MRSNLVASCVLALALLASPGLARATDYVVDTNGDPSVSPSCPATDSLISLREALTAVNSASPCGDAPAGSASNTITFDLAPGSRTIVLAQQMGISKPTSIDGGGVVVLDGNGASIHGLVVSGHDGSEIRGLTIRGFAGGTALLVSGEDHLVTGNRIGIDDAGTGAVPNRIGIEISNGSNIRIGGTDLADRNVIGGSIREAIVLGGTATAVGIEIVGNYVGVGDDGTTAIPNGTDGTHAITLNSNTQASVIGGTTAAHRNIIAGNTVGQIAIVASSAPVQSILIQGNYLGLDKTGQIAVESGRGGFNDAAISLASTNENINDIAIGGTGAGEGNTIASQNGRGIAFGGALGNISNVAIAGNRFGLAADGSTTRPITGVCVYDNEESTSLSIVGNVFGACSVSGVELSNASGVVVTGNYFGLDAGGTTRIPTSQWNLRINGGTATVGGSDSADRNVFSGPLLVGSGGQVTIERATIGVAANGAELATKPATGIYVASGAEVVVRDALVSGTTQVGVYIAGSAPTAVLLERVEIRNSGSAGAYVESDSLVEITQSTIVGSGGLAIDLFPDGLTTNDSGDGDTGPSGLQNFPVITSAVIADSGSSVSGTVATTASTTIRVELFATGIAPDATGHGELSAYLGSAMVTTDGSGDGSFTITPSRALVPGESLTTTATDTTALATSEASANFVVLDQRTSPPDAGVTGDDAGSDSGIGPEDAGVVDAGSEPAGSSSGCGCHVGRTETSSGALASFAALLVLLGLRRTRRASRSLVSGNRDAAGRPTPASRHRDRR